MEAMIALKEKRKQLEDQYYQARLIYCYAFFTSQTLILIGPESVYLIHIFIFKNHHYKSWYIFYGKSYLPISTFAKIFFL